MKVFDTSGQLRTRAFDVSATITSNTISVLSQQVSVLSNRVSVLSQAVSVLSTRVGQIAYISSEQAVVTSTLVNVSGLSLSVVFGGVYKIEAMLLHSFSTTSAGLGVGYALSWPLMNAGGGTIEMMVSAGQITGTMSSMVRKAGFGVLASGSVLVSATLTGVLSADNYPTIINALFVPALDGTLQVMVKGGISATTKPLYIRPGSFLRAMRIN